MKEIVVTSPMDCPFKLICGGCGLGVEGTHHCYDSWDFPSGCPLFENDYLIKRRCDGTTEDAEQKSEQSE